MKVNIGPHIYPFTTEWFKNYMNKKYDYSWPKEKDYTRFEKFLYITDNWGQNILNFTINRIQNNRKRIEKIKIDNYDVWNMDYTLGMIALPMLKKLKEIQHGAPYVDPEDVPEHLRPTKEQTEQYMKNGTGDPTIFERWDWVLGEMIFAFESKFNDWEDKFHSGEIKVEFVPIDKDGNEVPEDEAVYHEMRTAEGDTHVWDKEGHFAYQKRVSNGFRLFGAYYEGLWD